MSNEFDKDAGASSAETSRRAAERRAAERNSREHPAALATTGTPPAHRAPGGPSHERVTRRHWVAPTVATVAALGLIAGVGVWVMRSGVLAGNSAQHNEAARDARAAAPKAAPDGSTPKQEVFPNEGALAGAALQLPPECASWVFSPNTDQNRNVQFADGRVTLHDKFTDAVTGNTTTLDGTVTIVGSGTISANGDAALLVQFGCSQSPTAVPATSFGVYDADMRLTSSWGRWANDGQPIQGSQMHSPATGLRTVDGTASFTTTTGIVGDSVDPNTQQPVQSGLAHVTLAVVGDKLRVTDIRYEVDGRSFRAPSDFASLQAAYDAIAAGQDAGPGAAAVAAEAAANLDEAVADEAGAGAGAQDGAPQDGRAQDGGAGAAGQTQRAVYFPVGGKVTACGLAGAPATFMYGPDGQLVKPEPDAFVAYTDTSAGAPSVQPGEFICAVSAADDPPVSQSQFQPPYRFLRVTTDESGAATITGYGKSVAS